jgi:LPS O-antigen subunit length determinant protein (WzzB/FepE family)
MQNKTEKVDNNLTKEINIYQLINTLNNAKYLILGSTFLFTLIALIFALTLKSTFIVSAEFSSSNSILSEEKFSDYSSKKLLIEFIDLLSSKNFQKQFLINSDFLTLFNSNNETIDDKDEYAAKIIDTLFINAPSYSTIGRKETILNINELPHTISMIGPDSKLLSSYINELIQSVDQQIIFNLKKKLDASFKLISSEIETMQKVAKIKRLNQIKRIKEEDGQKIRQINDQIDRARYKAKEDRLNQIVKLIDSAKLAKSLGIIENNFKMVNNGGAKSDFTIAIGESKDFPEWYMYGEKALIKRIELLENRMSDDPFIPELVTLNNRLNEVQNNNLLKTLEIREDDSPFINELLTINFKKIEIELFLKNLNNTKVSSIFLNKSAGSGKVQKTRKKLIVIAVFIASLISSISLVLLFDFLKINYIRESKKL